MAPEQDNISIKTLKSFERLFTDYYPVVCSFADRYLDDEAMSQDVAQEAFERLWNKREEFVNIVSIKAYLFTIVRNICLKTLRDTPQKKVISDDLAENPDPDFAPAIIEEETINILYRAIDRLPPQSRRVMTLAVKGVKNAQIAEELGVSVNTVKTLKYNALETLRKNITRERHDAGDTNTLQVLLLIQLIIMENL